MFSCEADCSSNLEEVCGSNSVTYSSQCELEKHNCQNDLNLTVKHMGKCHSELLNTHMHGRNLSILSLLGCNRKREENADLKASIKTYRSHLKHIKNLLSECTEYMSLRFLETSDIPYPFEPECSEDDPNDYALYQYNQYCDMYWCSTTEGKLIEGTYQLDKVNCEKALGRYA